VALTVSSSYTFSCSNYSSYRWPLHSAILIHFHAQTTVYTGSPYNQQFLYIFMLKLQFMQVALTISSSYTFSCSNYSLYRWPLQSAILIHFPAQTTVYTGSPYNQQFLYIFLLKLQFIQVALTVSSSYTFSCSNYSLYRWPLQSAVLIHFPAQTTVYTGSPYSQQFLSIFLL